MSSPKFVEQAQANVSDGANPVGSGNIDEAVQDALGRKLREAWEQIVKEDVPQKFMDLLTDLKNSEQRGPGGGG
ncbi:MAG: NepR family anti-sigma factor [Hyphomicrobium sp.]|uniref:NepR family anti-sigma factor n=1 Tax=Hyphomicrobium sp. TaxID=82 RepID=UPI003D112AFF